MVSRSDHWYREATARWPSVTWSEHAYARHIGTQKPTHPIDLYLGGAAGHRVDAAWEAIETDICPVAQRVMARLPRGGSEADELIARARANWMKDAPEQPPLKDGRRPAKIVRYRGRVSLVNYMVTAARHLAISEHRKRSPQLSLEKGERDDEPGMAPPAADTQGPEVAVQERETIKLMQHALIQAFARLSPEQQFLLRMTVGQGMKQKDAGRLLGFSEFKTSRQLGKAHDQLRAALEAVADLEWTPALRDAWNTCWAKLLESVQDDAPPTSK